jgi:integrase
MFERRKDIVYNGAVMDLIKRGSILCSRCDAVRGAEVCSNGECKHVRCYIRIHWRYPGQDKGKYEYFFKDRNGRHHDWTSAVRDLIAINADIDRDDFDPRQWKNAVFQGRTFDSLWSAWIEEFEDDVDVGNASPATLKTYQSHYRVWLKRFEALDVRQFGNMQIKELSKALKGKSKKYRYNVFGTLHTYLVWVRDDAKEIKQLPDFPDFGDPLSESKEREAMSYDEQESAFSKLPSDHRDMYEFEAEVGCRPGEACVLKLSDLKKGWVLKINRSLSVGHIRERNKEKKPRLVYLSTKAKETVVRHMFDEAGNRRLDGFLFINPDTGRHYTPEFLRKLWRKTLGFTVPDHYAAVRTSYCTQMSELEGISDKELLQITGHADMKSLKRYLQSRDTTRQQQLVEAREQKRDNILQLSQTLDGERIGKP